MVKIGSKVTPSHEVARTGVDLSATSLEVAVENALYSNEKEGRDFLTRSKLKTFTKLA